MKALTFIDTNILKFAASELVRLQPRREQVQWGPTIVDLIVHDTVTVNPNDQIKNSELRAEADLLPLVATASKAGQIELVQSFEVKYEVWGLPSMDSETGAFYGAKIHTLKDIPFAYGRVVGGLDIDGKAEQLRFITGIVSPRLTELRKTCGAFQGARKPPNGNQLLDAFHIWCAELAGCTYFLTLDLKLQRMLKNGKSRSPVQVVRPSELLIALQSPTMSNQ